MPNNRNLIILFSLFFCAVGIFFLTLYLLGVSKTEEENIVVEKEIQPNISTENFEENKINLNTHSEKTENKNNTQTKEEYNLSDAIKYTKKQEALEKKIRSLTIETKQNLTIEDTCKSDNTEDEQNCKRGLFTSCADSLYLGFEMTEECKQFNTEDYDKFLKIKTAKDSSLNSGKIYKGVDYIDTALGRININENTNNSLTKENITNIINSSSINNSREISSKESLITERKIIEPTKAINLFQNIFLNKNVETYFTRWVSGWATLFAVNGGKNESGYRMNKTTAFGYNPYSSKTCIVSLPYKTIDLFYDTNLDYCVKTQNTDCVLKIKNKIKNAAIEIVMIKNGKRAVLPLGDFGPAEWTGNAIDLTSCAKNLLGATGKDIVKFRPLSR